MASTIPALTRLQIPLEEVKKATEDFDEKHVIARGGFGKVYKGQLSVSGKTVNIAARRLDPEIGSRVNFEFVTEINTLSSLEHENILSLVGFCDENGEKIIINEREATRGSLSMHLSKPTLTWIQRLKICVGVARALRYIHNDEGGRGSSMIHRNINSYTVLLDSKLEAKLSGFEFSKPQSVNDMDRDVRSDPIGITGYMDPSIKETKGVTHKSDIYSFGVVLCEILCGRKAFLPDADADNRYLAPLFRIHYDNGSLNDIIHPDLRHQMTQKSLAEFSQVAYSCLEEKKEKRPKVNDIVVALEKALELEILLKKSEHLKIPLSDITLATKNFSKSCHIRDTDYYEIYTTQLEHFDDEENPSFKERKSNGELSTRHDTVVIYRFSPRQDKTREEKFYTEIKMLHTCKHPSIVKLLGYCDEGSEIILVIEHLSNGYLDDYWKNNLHSEMPVLTWETRLKICIDVANALNYLHTKMEDQKMILHHDIKSSNIALDKNRGAKLIDFGVSLLLPLNQDDEARDEILGEEFYMDPEYSETGKYIRESDVYSFGVVLFEILSGRLADDSTYLEESDQGLAIKARRCFKEGTLIMEMIDPILGEESGENDLILKRIPNKYSLEKFVKIAHRCIAETHDQRPTMKMVVQELQTALFFQMENETQCLDMVEDVNEVKKSVELRLRIANWLKKLEHLKIPLSDILSATENFSESYHLRNFGYYNSYTVELEHFDEGEYSVKEGKSEGERPRRRSNVVINRFVPDEDEMFYTEIKMFDTCKHPMIVKLLGFCDDGYEMILVVEHFSNGYLDHYWENHNGDVPILTWEKRLKICLDIANSLNYLHNEIGDRQSVVHRDIQSNKIVLDENWGAKIADFGFSIIQPHNQDDDEAPYVDKDDYWETDVHMDPEYTNTHKLTRESDVYSFGVVLFEVLCGKLANDSIFIKESDQGLAFVARRCLLEGTLMDWIDPTLKRGPNKDSLDKFVIIAHKCIAETQDQRPTMKVVIQELQEALFFQLKQLDGVSVADEVEEDEIDCPDMVEDVVEVEKSVELEVKELDHLKIPLSDIEWATGSFSKTYNTRDTEYYKSYTTELEHFDEQGANEEELPRKSSTVVINRFNPSAGEEMFYTEIKMLHTCKHPSIVKLLGFCDEASENILVVEHLSKGSLYNHLWYNEKQILTWAQRLKICLDVANALTYLHNGIEDRQSVVHRNIQSNSIALDENWGAKIVDFGYSEFQPPNQDDEASYNENVWVTTVCMDPEYTKTHKLTRESDVYSFGVVLFEVLCGRVADDEIYTEESKEGGLAFVIQS
uniref:uncharacterized protein LOC122583758 n=1 Tax=Erigeron canadensis TaxID=72917 RepID=UPI001CB89BD5|nr:uncharacterized protein LOC122583758 [Erigeron canadensis]